MATDPNRALLTTAMATDVIARDAKAQFKASNLVGVIPVANLPIASTTAVGVVKPGTGMTINSTTGGLTVP